ncbi:hypothetical protein BJV82DRAFT_579660 [Fennellomyces sp. T-0311]|nr:hypothetical protein BJV82DRAFT_579660 [Fennellomyces sp. T-0311]
MASASEDLGYLIRVHPNYPSLVFRKEFQTIALFNTWVKENPNQHATFITNRKYEPPKASDVSQTPGTRGSGRPKTLLSSTTYICDHARCAPPRNPNGPNKKPRTSKNTIKVNCPAKYLVKYLLDGKVKVEYHWKHENHDPTEISDAVRSKLPPTTLQWIQNHVDNHLDWEKIQEHLRLTEEELQAYNILITRPEFQH